MHYDALIIGAGQAIGPLVTDFTKRGWRFALAEGHYLGGSCINYGCTPTKTIIASARAAYLARRGADFGVETGPVHVDFARVMARKDEVVQSFRSGMRQRFEDNDNLTLYHDYAGFVDPHRVAIGEEIVEADRIYLNVGTRARTLPIPGLDDVPFLTNASLLELREMPEHLVIIGGGYIGLEFAQAYHRFGSHVTIIEDKDRLMSHSDPDVAEAALELLRDEGIDIQLNARTQAVKMDQGRIVLELNQNGTASEVTGSHLLLAVGRVPNSDTLQLEKAGVATGERGYITVDDHLRTNVPHIWALGDVNGQGAFTHTSYNDGEIVVDNLNGGSRKVSDRIPIYAMFIDPPLGHVGMTETQARASGRKVLKGTMPMSSVSRAIERSETRGLIKVLVDADTERFLGATILGIGGDEVIHIFADLMTADAPYTVMRDTVHIHPTVSELLPTVLTRLAPLE